ncbi:MAG: CHAT domain-containing protein [Planctomycetota bacterium]|nr:CHAT domain-containing protein [Planctomycetota bacterium]
MSNAGQIEHKIAAALASSDCQRAEVLAEQYRDQAQEPVAGELAQSEWFRSRYLSVRVSLHSGQLEAVLKYAEPLLGRVHDVPPELACELLLTVAEVRARLGQTTDARNALAKAVIFDRLLQTDRLLRLRHLRARLLLGDVSQLASELTACYRMLEQDHANHALLLIEEGRAWESTGDLRRAEACWQHAGTIAQQVGASPVRTDALLQLGRLRHLRGELQAALDAYDEAAENAIAGTPQVLELRLRHLLVELELNRWKQVQATYRRLLPDDLRAKLPSELRGLAATLGVLLEGDAGAPDNAELRAYRSASRGDRATARRQYTAAFESAQDPVRRARLALALGLLELAEANRTEAQRWLDLAEPLARAHGLDEVLWRCLEARGQAFAEIDSDDERARPCYEEAIAVSERQRAQFRSGLDAAAYAVHRTTVAQYLLRGVARRDDGASLFQYQELERGRLQLELRLAGERREGFPENAAWEQLSREWKELAEHARPDDPAGSGRGDPQSVEQERLLEQYLSDASRRGDYAIPAMSTLADLERSLPSGSVFVSASIVEDEIFWLVVRPGKSFQIVRVPDANAVTAQVRRLRQCIESQLRSSARSQERGELDKHLTALGEGPLGTALGQTLRSGEKVPERVLWIPDGDLSGLPLHAVRWKGRYLIETHEFVYDFSGSWVVYQAQASHRRRLRWGGPLMVVESPERLRFAEREAEGVAMHLAHSRILRRDQANRENIHRYLRRAKLLHVACHAHFDPHRPADAYVQLPSGESWHGVEWLNGDLLGMPLVALSACRTAQTSAVVGQEVFGLVSAALAGGAGNVLAGLWPVLDQDAVALMCRFYHHWLTQPASTALALAQREALADARSSPLAWAVFALFGDCRPCIGSRWWWRWWARFRQRRQESARPVHDAAIHRGVFRTDRTGRPR